MSQKAHLLRRTFTFASNHGWNQVSALPEVAQEVFTDLTGSVAGSNAPNLGPSSQPPPLLTRPLQFDGSNLPGAAYKAPALSRAAQTLGQPQWGRVAPVQNFFQHHLGLGSQAITLVPSWAPTANHQQKVDSLPSPAPALSAAAAAQSPTPQQYQPSLSSSAPVAPAQLPAAAQAAPIQAPFRKTVQLNKQIMASRSTSELLGLVRSKGTAFDFFNISSAISKVPKLLGVEAGHSEVHLDVANRALVDDLAKLMCKNIDSFDARGLANSAWAFAKLKYTPNAVLPSLIAKAAVEKMDQFVPQNLSNLLWSMVYMHHKDAKLFQDVADKVKQRVTEFKPQELANITWAFASLDCKDDEMVKVVAQQSLKIAPHFKEQELSNITWAFAKLQGYNPALFSALVHETKAKLPYFLPQGISNIAWALATAGHHDTQFFDMVVRQCGSSLASFDVQALSNLLWSMATLGYKDTPFVNAAVHECMARLDRMNTQNLTNVIWACATLNHKENGMLAAWSRAVTEKLPSFEPQGLSTTAWAFAKLGHTDAHLFDAMAAAAAQKLDAFNAQGLSNLAWAFATAHNTNPKLFGQISQTVLDKIDGFNAQNCSMTVWAFATLRHYDEELFAAVLQQLCGVVDSCEPQNIANALWAYARMGHSLGASGPVLLRQALAVLPRMEQQELCNTFWALAVLDLLDLETFGVFCDALRRVDGITPEGLHQAFHAQLMFHSSLARHSATPYLALNPQVLPQLPPALQVAAHSLWLKSAKDVTVSRFQQEVNSALQATGVPTAMEWLTDDGLFSIDIAFEVDRQAVAVEVDGVHHYTSNAPYRPLSDVAVRRQLLQDRGWKVVNVGFMDWTSVMYGLRPQALVTQVAQTLGTYNWQSITAASRKMHSTPRSSTPANVPSLASVPTLALTPATQSIAWPVNWDSVDFIGLASGSNSSSSSSSSSSSHIGSSSGGSPADSSAVSSPSSQAVHALQQAHALQSSPGGEQLLAQYTSHLLGLQLPPWLIGLGADGYYNARHHESEEWDAELDLEQQRRAEAAVRFALE